MVHLPITIFKLDHAGYTLVDLLVDQLIAECTRHEGAGKPKEFLSMKVKE